MKSYALLILAALLAPVALAVAFGAQRAAWGWTAAGAGALAAAVMGAKLLL